MQKIIITLIAIAILVSGYRLIAGRKKTAEEKPLEITEVEIAATPTPVPEEVKQIKGAEAADQDLPSSGISGEEEPPTQEEIRKILQEFGIKE